MGTVYFYSASVLRYSQSTVAGGTAEISVLLILILTELFCKEAYPSFCNRHKGSFLTAALFKVTRKSSENRDKIRNIADVGKNGIGGIGTLRGINKPAEKDSDNGKKNTDHKAEKNEEKVESVKAVATGHKLSEKASYHKNHLL